MKIVITDAQTVVNDDVSLMPLDKLGQVVTYNLTDYEQIKERIKDADAVICNKTVLDKNTMSLAKKLRYIGLFATGYNNIDIDYCNEHNITVCNAGSYSSNAVAQHTFAMILEHYSNVGNYNAFCHSGGWQNSPTFSPFVYSQRELFNKSIGIVGYGAIGMAVKKIALAFGMRVLVFTRTKKEDSDVTFTDFHTLLKESDIVTVHTPLNSESQNMFDKSAFDMMKKGAFFVNTARGKVMDEDALVNALNRGRLSGAAVDVLDIEPMRGDSPLPGTKSLIITPHIAWAPVETRLRVIDIVAENLRAFLSGAPVNVVNNPKTL